MGSERARNRQHALDRVLGGAAIRFRSPTRPRSLARLSLRRAAAPGADAVNRAAIR
jgi:hypothetical protein